MKDPREFTSYDDSPLNDGWNWNDPEDNPYFGYEYKHERDEEIEDEDGEIQSEDCLND